VPDTPRSSWRERRPDWLTTPVLTVAVLSVASGLAQFSVTTVIGDVAAHFGEPGVGDELTAQLGLPATTVGVALALIRLSSLGSLPAAAMADRLGRRRVLLSMAGFGLSVTALAALAPSFWAYVALVALARPALSTVNALSGVVAAEETTAATRSAGIALITAAYGLGSGIVSVGRGLLPGEPSFRVVTGFVLVPLLLLPLLARRIREPKITAGHLHPEGVLGTVPRVYRGRVALLAGLTGAIALATGPGFTYLFVYGERVLDATPLLLSLLVIAAGPVGLAGILAGRWGAERYGRRATGAVAMAATGLAVAYGYAGTTRDLAVGYLVTIAASSAFAPPTGALTAELVPTSVRATAAGWMTLAGVVGAVLGLTLFGVLADLTGGFTAAARTLGVLVAVLAVGFVGLPETRGTELASLEED